MDLNHYQGLPRHTGSRLVRLWVSRDIRYQSRRARLPSEQVAAALTWRQHELDRATEPGLRDARLYLAAWPPFEIGGTDGGTRASSQAHHVSRVPGAAIGSLAYLQAGGS